MYKASYYDDFECIGSKCPNSCCIGWTIDLDMETYVKYLKKKDSHLENNLIKNSNPTLDKFAKIKLDKNDRCSFLCKDNLCNVQKKYSKSLLSKTCSSFPRRKVNYGSTEISSGMISCPEISRLLFSDNDVFKIVDHENKIQSSENLNIIPNEYKDDNYAVDGEKIFKLLLKIYNDKSIPLEVCLSITNQIIFEVEKAHVNSDKVEEIFDYIKDFFKNYNFERMENASLQVNFAKGFFESFLKSKMNGKLSQVIKKLYMSSFMNLSHDNIVKLFSEKRDTVYKQFSNSNKNIFKKFFIHEFFGRISFLTNKNIKSKDIFYVIFFSAIVSRIILIFGSMFKKNLTLNDFIEIISLVLRYFGAKEKLGKAEQILVESNDDDFTSLFYLFF